jgi:hypothetical protein
MAFVALAAAATLLAAAPALPDPPVDDLSAAPAPAVDARAGAAPLAGVVDRLGLQLSGRAGAWTHDRDLNDETLLTFLALRARLQPRSGALDATVEAYAQVDRTGWRTDLVDAWARLSSGALEIRAGRQVVVWGRADRLNPTDNLSGRDYTLLTATDDEQRLGPAMVQLRLGAGNLTFDAIWIPEFRPNIFPLEQSRPGVALVPTATRSSAGQFALRVDSSGGDVDWSLSWFHGIDRNRDFTGRPAPRGAIAAVQQTFPDINVLGADMAGTRGASGWRIEAAYTIVRGADSSADSSYVKNDNLWIVGGGDVGLGDGWNLNLQYSLRVIFDHSDPRRIADPVTRSIATLSAAVNNQLDPVQNGFTARIARRFANDAAEAELAIVHYLEPGDSAIRPRIGYSIRDGLRIAAGADIFTGPRNSYFGRVRSLSAGWLQLSAGF